MTTPDEAKRAAVENFQAQHDVACRTGTATSVIPSTRVAFYAGFDAGHASRDAEVEALQAEVEAAKADRNERHEKVVEFMDKYEASRAQVERLTKALERLVGRDIGCITPPPDAPMDWPGYGSFHCPWCAGKAALALSPVGGGDGGGR